MENTQLSFEQVMNATVRLLRTTWKAKVCLFLQRDDQGDLRVRASDGLPLKKVSALTIDPEAGPFKVCFSKNRIMEVDAAAPMGSLSGLLKPFQKKGEKFVLVPVSGETRVLGTLFMGPFPRKERILQREAELRSAGALCTVLSAHWRLYQWMSNFVPNLNHELRTPLTAVQGSIGMVLGGMFGQVGTDVKEMLEMAQKGCERTVRAIEEYINTQNPQK
jgi:transcriptional regulator with GAF, ATPase, and Fis domain